MTFPELFNADVAIWRDIPYSHADPRQMLDIYAPVSVDAAAVLYPVVLFFYGGGWRSGDKRLFEHLGRAFAVRGIVAVTVNYRLTPSVRGPEHARDCARSVRWSYDNIIRYGGDPGAMFLTGHSAGAHLAALIALDRSYLTEAGVSDGAVAGVAMISGVVDLADHTETTAHTSREQIEEAFGSSPEELAAASPINYLRPGLPPFLVIVAESDPPGIRAQGKRFADELRESGGDVLYISVKGRDHYSIVRRFGPTDDPTVGAIADFIKHYSHNPS